MKLLNTRQEAFCLHYARSGNATEAYKAAGYACKNDDLAGSSASRLKTRPEIKARLAELAEELRSERIASVREVQERLTSILRGELREEQVVLEGCGEGMSEARVVERAPQLKDVTKAAELLAKMQGGFDNTATLNVVVPVFGGEDELSD